MAYLWFFIGLFLLLGALNVNGFFKIILWAVSISLMLYSLPKTGLMSEIAAEETFAVSLFLVGIIQMVASFTEYKLFGVVIFREVTDFIIFILGLGMIIIGLIIAI